MKITAELRQILLEHPDVNAVCHKAGVSRVVVWRFINGSRGLTLKTIDKLASVLKLRLVREWSWQDQSAV